MLEAVVAGLFGLLIGSFLNVCIYRLPLDLSVVRPRSYCPACKHPIAWFDNIPVLTWIVLRGRCRRCAAEISARYPLVEALTGVLFFVGVLGAGPGVEALRFCTLAAILVTLIFTDLEERILPDEFTLGGTIAGVIFAWFAPLDSTLAGLFLSPDTDARVVSVLDVALAALLLAGVLWSIGAFYRKVRGREGLGLGDVKLVACLGAFLGASPALLAITVGSLMGSVFGITYILVARKDAATYELPFGSFLALAGILVALWSGPLKPCYVF